MNEQTVRELLIAIDMELTGVSIRQATLTQQSQVNNISTLAEGSEIEYYLSDSGYSRVWIDAYDKRVFLTDNSTVKVKARWGTVQGLVTSLKEQL